MNFMKQDEWHIYLDKFPYPQSGCFWVSFESNPDLKKTKSNIYGRCLPCIQNLYQQLKEGHREITLGPAYNCWKITAIVKGFEECLTLLCEFERKFPVGHVYGKLGSGRSNSETMVVVFHAENASERDRLRKAWEESLKQVTISGEIQISRACSILYNDILEDWRKWRPTTPIKHPENVGRLLERIKQILYRTVM